MSWVAAQARRSQRDRGWLVSDKWVCVQTIHICVRVLVSTSALSHFVPEGAGGGGLQEAICEYSIYIYILYLVAPSHPLSFLAF